MTTPPSAPLHRVAVDRPQASSLSLRQSATASIVAAGTFCSPLEAFAGDPTLSPFLSSSFSSTTFSSAALSSGSPASIAEHLHRAIHLLESQIRTEVLSRNAELLDQLSSLRDAEHALSAIRSSVSSLKSSVLRVRYQVSEPQKLIQLKTIQLSNLNRSIETLQQTIRTLRLSRKLRDLVHQWETESEKVDLGKAAHMYCEILSSCDEFKLQGIVAVDEEVVWVKEMGERLRNAAMAVLEKGMESLNQTEVGTGLQIFHNLGELRSVVERFVSKYKLIAERSIAAALDRKAISGSVVGAFGPGGIKGSGTPQIGGGVKAREGIWQRMQSCMDQLQTVVVAVWHLQRVLSKKKDPFTHVLLLDEAIKEGESMLTDQVWAAMANAFAAHMKSAFTASSFVKEIFTNGYPKLFFMVENLLERISRDTDIKGTLPAITVDQKDEMVAAIAVFQTAFLASCLSRLSDLVNTIFSVSSRGTVPSMEQISRILSRIQEEIEAVQFDGRLTLLVLHEISKVLLLLAERAEYQISTGQDVRQVSSTATPAQLKNFALYQLLQETHTRMSSLILQLPSSTVSDVLSPSLGAIYGVARDSVVPLFTAMINQLENCMLQIHQQNFGSVHGVDSSGDSGASSPYMEELQRQILHFRTEFLSRLFPSPSTKASGTETICMQLGKSLAARVLVFFVRHASLIRPLSDSGKLRMVRDMAELELTVSQNLYPVEQLGPPYQALRAFRPLIFLDTSQLFSSPLLQELPPSITLHHLYSRAPDELQSPLQRNMLTPLQYSLWLDSQGEEQIWKGIKATLDDYCAQVKSRGDKEFSPLYPLMLQLGSSLVENASSYETKNT